MVRKHRRRLRSLRYTKMRGKTITVGKGNKNRLVNSKTLRKNVSSKREFKVGDLVKSKITGEIGVIENVNKSELDKGLGIEVNWLEDMGTTTFQFKSDLELIRPFEKKRKNSVIVVGNRRIVDWSRVYDSKLVREVKSDPKSKQVLKMALSWANEYNSLKIKLESVLRDAKRKLQDAFDDLIYSDAKFNAFLREKKLFKPMKDVERTLKKIYPKVKGFVKDKYSLSSDDLYQVFGDDAWAIDEVLHYGVIAEDLFYEVFEEF